MDFTQFSSVSNDNASNWESFSSEVEEGHESFTKVKVSIQLRKKYSITSYSPAVKNSNKMFSSTESKSTHEEEYGLVPLLAETELKM